MENIENIIADFDKQISQIESERKPLYDLRDKFVTYFNKEKLATMTIEEYCGGFDDHNFCYGLWETLKGLSYDLATDHDGNSLSSQSNKSSVCGVALTKDSKYKFDKKWQNKGSDSFTEIKHALIDLYDAGINENWDTIRKNNLHSWFKIKFLSTYFPEKYVGFCNKQFLKQYCQFLFGIKAKGNDDAMTLQTVLLNHKMQHQLMVNWPLDIFAYFLWNYVKEENNVIIKKQESMESSLVTTYKSFLLKNHNMIFTGAPGTGKTYLAKQIAASIMGCDVKNLKGNKQFGFVQFHPSYDYTDFVEGLRPSEDESKEFELRQGIFKQFCASALENAESKDFEEAYTKLLDDLENMDEPMSVVTSKSTFGISLNSRGNLNLHTGKNMQKNGVLVREALEATANGQPSYKYWQCYYKGVIELLKGKYGLVITETKKRKDFVFIIDEINRGEISKIFGELFFSIDPGYRGETGIVKTQYQNMVVDGPFMDGFYVPDNVYIIGTMNDIDRSVETLDFAFRRRFPSIEITYEDTLDGICCDLDDAGAKEHLKSLNKVISEDENLGLGSEYCIGGAYLLKLKDVDYKYEDLWKFYIEPVIAEYFRGLPSLERKANIDTLKKAFLTKSNETKNEHEE